MSCLSTIALSRQVPNADVVKSSNNRSVTFDLWETLIFDEPEKDGARGRMRCEGLQVALASLGIELDLDDLMRGYEQSALRLQGVWDRNDEMPIVEQIRLIVELAAGRAYAFDPSWNSRFEEAYVNPIISIPPRLNAEAPAVLRALQSRGYKLGLISNTGRSPGSALRAVLETYGVLKFFDATVFSNEVMRRKPDPTIFNRTARLLEAEKGAVVHVGDNPEADFWGARNVGMHAILLDQALPNSSQWPPHSLFALARANSQMLPRNIEPRLRIESLTRILDLIDSFFQA
jgi:putative hydrolase of the HAD superfamily